MTWSIGFNDAADAVTATQDDVNAAAAREFRD